MKILFTFHLKQTRVTTLWASHLLSRCGSCAGLSLAPPCPTPSNRMNVTLARERVFAEVTDYLTLTTGVLIRDRRDDKTHREDHVKGRRQTEEVCPTKAPLEPQTQGATGRLLPRVFGEHSPANTDFRLWAQNWEKINFCCFWRFATVFRKHCVLWLPIITDLSLEALGQAAATRTHVSFR